MKQLFLILVLLAVSLVVVKYKKRKLDKPNAEQKKGRSSENGKVVKCLHCGLHVPEEEAIRKGDKVFCSLEHAGQEI